MKYRIIVALVVVCCFVLQGFGQGANRGTAETTVNGKAVSIDYGRPMRKDRDLLGLAQVGMVWRLGSNKATEITSAGDLTVGGTTLKAGKYTLWAKKTSADTWALEFHPKTGVWGAPPLTEGFVAELPLNMQTAGDAAEQLTITLGAKGGDAQIGIHWGTAMLTGSFGVK
jgi:hypothetical protein